MRLKIFSVFLLAAIAISGHSQNELITNIAARKTFSLDGKWQYIIDPYETGFTDYRFKERSEKDAEAYWNTDIPANRSDRKEHGFIAKYSLNVPGDWNSQDAKFLYYEGTVWYRKLFNYKKSNASNHLYLYFGAVNYKADVYLNGHKLGQHKGGFTAFNFEVPDSILKEENNNLVVKVDNKRYADEVPALNTDWWNYGGITRTVQLIELPQNFIQDYSLQLASSGQTIKGWVKLNSFTPNEKITIEIPELKIKKIINAENAISNFSINISSIQRWSPEDPKLYNVVISTASNLIREKIGFRNIEIKGTQVMLNGKPIFMRGISIHAEVPQEVRRSYSKADAEMLLGWAKELNCNMVRLAHYPHDENMVRVADSLGILVWSEIPVYWTIDFKNADVLAKAKSQLSEMITRDHNRASIIIWSVGNETPVNETRNNFMHSLLSTAKLMDSSRIISAALEVNYASANAIKTIDDPLGKYVDMVSFNEYLGWYTGLPSDITKTTFNTIYNKPLFISETGAEALSGFKADSLTRFSEEYQTWFYKEQIAMLRNMPENFVGICPWILADFRSPRRNNPTYQEGWNNKGLIDQHGKKKPAFFVLQSYYAEMKQKFETQNN
ncbi:MAG: beta galactosidase jelly roll domain-containing protein [Bacteroidota bacterium]|nr:beta galactosidase jelly roll domain-containing protein [Bacteroidota bacterium]